MHDPITDLRNMYFLVTYRRFSLRRLLRPFLNIYFNNGEKHFQQGIECENPGHTCV